MAKGEEHSNNANEQQTKESLYKSPYESIVVQAVSKIKNEPFLFVMGVTALLVGMATLATKAGPSDLRIIVIVIACLSFLVIIGYYIRDALTQRTDPQRQKPFIPPVFKESERFVELSTFSQKKEMLIHPFEVKLATGTLEFSEEQQQRCEASPWDFDRIVLYLHEWKSKQPKFNERLQHITQEWEKLRASEGRRSLIPLHYAVRSILRFLERQEEPSKEAQSSLSFFRVIFEYLKTRPEIDQGGEVKANITSVIGILAK